MHVIKVSLLDLQFNGIVVIYNQSCMIHMGKKEYLFDGEGTEETVSTTDSNLSDIYPDATLNIYRDTASVFQMKRKWEKIPSMLNLTPKFQRELVWNSKQKSELIESMIMGIPLPAFYVREDKNGVYIVVDGKQRLTALFEFIDCKYRLSKLNILKKLEGKNFEELSPIEQNKIEDYTLSINVIKAPTSDRVTFDLFDRVNRGGTHLNNQEMRNALYQGTSTELINNLAKMECYRTATEKSIPPTHMKDRYLILRFLAFYLYKEEKYKKLISADNITYKSNIDDFLGKTMDFINKFSSDSDFIKNLINVFIQSMKIASRVIVPIGGFRLPPEPGKNRRPINMAFFESFSYLLAKANNETDEFVVNAYHSLLNDDIYINAVTYSVDNSNQTEKRYNCIDKILNTVKYDN